MTFSMVSPNLISTADQVSWYFLKHFILNFMYKTSLGKTIST